MELLYAVFRTLEMPNFEKLIQVGFIHLAKDGEIISTDQKKWESWHDIKGRKVYPDLPYNKTIEEELENAIAKRLLSTEAAFDIMLLKNQNK